MEREALDDAFFYALVDSSINPFVVLDREGFVMYTSRQVESLLGRPPDDYIGHHFLEFLAPSSRELAIASYDDFAGVGRPEQPWLGPALPLDLVDVNGDTVPCEVAAVSPDQSGVGHTVLQVRRARGPRL